jgi:16S rRNA (guanine527-N7)-methyltransferase
MGGVVGESAGAGEVLELFNVSRESSEKLHVYADLLNKWQKQINLVGPKELPRLWSRHIADGLQLVEFLPEELSCVVDLGSGAGIPGLVVAMALCGRATRFHLIESNGKKAAFLREAVRVLGLPVQVHCQRIESLHGADWAGDVELVLARALAPLPLLMDLSVPFVENSGEMLFLKGLDVDSELTQTTKYWNIGYQKNPSRTNANGCILSIKEFHRVQSKSQPGDE